MNRYTEEVDNVSTLLATQESKHLASFHRHIRPPYILNRVKALYVYCQGGTERLRKNEDRAQVRKSKKNIGRRQDRKNGRGTEEWEESERKVWEIDEGEVR